MNNQPTEKQMIEAFAEFMGWEKCEGKNSDGSPYFRVSLCPENHTPQTGYDLICAEDDPKERWNPTKDENHFRQLLEKVMEDTKLFQDLCWKFIVLPEHNTSAYYIKATLIERCRALYSVLNSQKE